MKAQSTAKPEQSRHQDSRDRGGQGQGQQAMAVLDSRPEMAQQQGLLSLMAGSPRLQRKCACGAPSAAGGSCAACEGKQNSAKPVVLQKQLAIGAADDPLEREADRVADQVMAGPPHAPVSGAPLRIQRFTGQGGGQMDRAPASVERVLAGSGRPLEPALRRDMEQRFGHDFSRVRIHTGAEAGQSARDVNAKAYTVGHHVVFSGEQFTPGTYEGKRLLAHELTHVLQQGFSGINRQIMQRDIWYRGEGTGVAPASLGGAVHDFGDGLYMTNSPELAAEYAVLRSGSIEGSTPLVLSAEIESSSLGRVLNLLTDTRWQQFLAESPIPGGPTHQALIQMANENYWAIFQGFLERNGLSLESFDAIIGQEFVRPGTQICIRRPSIASQIRALLRPYVPPAASGATTRPTSGASAPTTPISVATRYSILSTTVNNTGNTVAEVEILLGRGSEELRRLASSASPPSRIVLRITTNAEGAFVGAESVGIELSTGVTEALARQIIATLPESAAAAGTEGAVAGTTARAAGTSRWVRGLGWAGMILFIGVTAYQFSQARTDRARGRVLATAGAGFAGGVLGTYIVCNLIFGLETFGLSLIGCSFAAGGASAYLASEATGNAYDEATATPLERSMHILQAQPEMVKRLFFGMLDSNGSMNGVPLSDELVREFIRMVPASISQYEVSVLLGNLRQTGRADTVSSVIAALLRAIGQLPGRRPISLPAALDITERGRGSTIFPYQINTDTSVPLGPLLLLPPIRPLPSRLGNESDPAERRPAPFAPLVEIAL